MNVHQMVVVLNTVCALVALWTVARLRVSARWAKSMAWAG